jgi:hypothetical protein
MDHDYQIGELMKQLDSQDLAQLQSEGLDPQQRYDVGGAEPIVNPVNAAKPAVGNHPLDPQNGALARLFRNMPRTQGKPIVPGLKDHSDQNESGMGWHETGGV